MRSSEKSSDSRGEVLAEGVAASVLPGTSFCMLSGFQGVGLEWDSGD